MIAYRGALEYQHKGALLILATIHECGAQFCTADVARSSAEVSLHSNESQLQDICSSKSSLQEEVSRLQSDKSRLAGQCEVEAQRGGSTRHLLESASKTNCSLHDNIWELTAQYDQEIADLG